MSRKPAAVEPPPAEHDNEPIANESPLLDTSSDLAKAMFATFNDVGIVDRDARLLYVSDVVGRDVTSSSDMTDDDARKVLDALRADLENTNEALPIP